MREIKFRGWDKSYGKMTEPFTLWETPTVISFSESGGHMLDITESTPLMQFTGLKDKNGKSFIYEGDFVSLDGQLIGNQYENPNLFKGEFNLLIAGMGTKEWRDTEQEACKRGCYYA